ncbi:MAG: family 1 glycosylhydrolase [Christensenellaceae bacterium]|nr:family 1 glycosylhydrolase [Christensenellaceae bacterium]
MCGQLHLFWWEGYSKRFGLIYVDYNTLERIPKDSYYWYRDVIAQNALEVPDNK